MRVARLARAAALLVVTAATRAAAQTPTRAPAPTAEITPRVSARPRITQTASTNPIAIPFGVASGEYERAVGTRGLSVGVGALTTLGRDNQVLNDGGSAVFRSLNLKLKYYPREDGLRGFAVGVTAGVAHERSLLEAAYSCVGGPCVPIFETFSTRTAPTLGATLDYNFLIGRQRRFLLGVGVGARRALGVSERGALRGPLIDPRLQIGVGF